MTPVFYLTRTLERSSPMLDDEDNDSEKERAPMSSNNDSVKSPLLFWDDDEK